MCGDSSHTEAGGGTDSDDRLPRRAYDLFAEIDLEHAAFVLSPSTGRADGSVVELECLHWRGDDRRFLFSARTDDFARFESALVDDATVARPTHICTSDGRRWYRAERTDDAESPLVPVLECDAFVRRAVATGGRWSFRLRLDGRETLIELRSACRNRGIDMHVTRLVQTEGPGDCEYHGLTEDQYELLELAFENGYYDVPRQISQTKLAEELDVSPSAISQSLRRAIAALIAATLTDRSP